MSRTANDEQTEADARWGTARNELFRMIMEGRSFSGRERNCLFLNTGSGKFATVSGISGVDFPDDGRCLGITDWDRDGDQDLWIANRSGPRLRLLRNDAPVKGNFVSLGLVGNGRDTNRDAIGARVEVVLEAGERAAGNTDIDAGTVATPAAAASTTATASGTRLVQTLRAGEGFLSQSSKWLHFGLGDAERIAEIRVRWPNGQTATYPGCQINQRYRLTQGRDAGELVPLEPPAPLPVATPDPPPPTQVARVALVTRVPMPKLAYRTDEGTSHALSFEGKQPTLVILWASWCRPCLEELAALAEHAADLRGQRLRILALNIDALSDNEPFGDSLDSLLQQLGFSAAWGSSSWGRIDSAGMNLLQGLHDEFFFMKRPLPLPSSFLVDGEGRLSVIYRGPVEPSQLQADLALNPQSPAEARMAAACLPGRTLTHPRVEQVAQRDDLQTRYRVAAYLEASQRFEDALRCFQQLAGQDPAWALPHRHLAKLYLQQDRVADAEVHLRQAEANDPAPNAAVENTAGLILSRLGKTAAAEARLQRAVELNPNFAEAFNNLGSIQASQAKLTAARASFARAVEIDPLFAEALTNLGSTYAAQDQPQEAMRYYQRAVEANPNYADAYNNLGTMHARLGNLREAARYYQEVLRLEPQHPDARRNLERARQLQSAGGR